MKNCTLYEHTVQNVEVLNSRFELKCSARSATIRINSKTFTFDCCESVTTDNRT